MTLRLVGNPIPFAIDSAPTTSSAWSPFGETVKYDPTSPSLGGWASTMSDSIPARCRAMAVTGPAMPAPTTIARMLSFPYHFGTV
jgi:hypothetical protein